MQDINRPVRRDHNKPSKKERIKNQDRPRIRLVSHTRVRFVYENELKGQWFMMEDAFDVPVLPNPDYKVIRIEFSEVEY